MAHKLKGLDTLTIKIPSYKLVPSQNFNEVIKGSYKALSYVWYLKFSNSTIYSYYMIKLPIGYQDVSMSWKFGVINSKKNICQVEKYERKVTTSDTEYIGLSPQSLTYQKALEYKTGDHITFCSDLEKCDYEHNQPVLLQAIYEKLYSTENHYLIQYQAGYLKLQNDYQQLQDELAVKDDVITVKESARSVLVQEVHTLRGLVKSLQSAAKSSVPVLQSNTSNSNSSSTSPILASVVNDPIENKSASDIMTILLNKLAITQPSIDSKDEKSSSIDTPFDYSKLSLETALHLQDTFYSYQAQLATRIKELNTCGICCDKQINVIFVPCGHKCTCLVCAKKITSSTPAECPICRAKITTIHKIY